ncbi:MAG: hypothetical protein IKC65_00105 [Lentisphaeria bacterium]|nr:hypothetical protein [Lentisphaeria bacterium]
MKLFRTLLVFSAALLLAGCTAVFEEELSPAEITPAQLESRMKQAMDPTGRFAGAKTYVMRQQISTARGWLEPPLLQMVEVKFRRPDQFKLTTYTDNEAETVLIARGKEGWMADMKRKKLTRLDDKALQRVLAMAKLTNPGNRMADVFEKITLDRSRVEQEDFFRFTCQNPGRDPIYIYVDTKEYLTRRMRMRFRFSGGSFDYDSQMLNYSMYEGVRIPDESVIRQAGIEQKSKVIYYKLDVKLDDDEFRPPLF